MPVIREQRGDLLKVLRVAHHAVVSDWRERERRLIARGVRVELFSARRWNEGGRDIDLQAGEDGFVHPVRTIGSHPNAFLYHPFRLWRALRAGPDLIDLHEEPVSLATAEVLALRRLAGSRAPVVLYSAQNIDKRYPIPFRWLERRALHRAAAAYVCNARAGEILTAKGLRGPAALIPLGVDVEQFAPADRGAPGTRPTIGYIGRLEPHKGVSVLLDAIAANPTWRLHISGEGSERRELERRAEALGISDRVSFLGFADGTELARRYRDLDVLAVPSLPRPGWLEQFCRVAVEAMASGVPVVASRSGAIPDVVQDVGELVAPDDSDDLARGIRAALEPRTWQRMRGAGLLRSRDFTWDRVAELHHELYRGVLPSARTASDGAVVPPPQVVVVAYGSPRLLRGALETIGTDASVTIVDNSSSPETRALADETGAHYLDPGRNLGFGAGVNVGLASLDDRGLSGSDILLLNPDARIGMEGVAEMQRHLHAAARRGVVGATQVDPATGDPVRVWWPAPHPARAVAEAVGLGRLNRAREFAIGSILLLRAEAIADVGRFDERFFLYTEEADWQKRARQRGWGIDVAEVSASHVGGGTSDDAGLRDRHFHASIERYIRKHYGALGWAVFRGSMVAGGAFRGLLLRGEPGRAARARARLYVRGPVAELERSIAQPSP